MRLLLVEDDLMIGESVLDLLRAEAYAVDWVRTGTTAEAAMAAESYDLVLLDLGLPGKDGLEVLRGMRARKQRVPVLVATARDAVSQRVEGLDNGADDYIVKPYDLDELLARIRALLRRSAGRAEPVYEYQNVSINPATREVAVDGQAVLLSHREWAILEALLARPGLILSRAQLEEKLFSWKDDISSNAVEVYIHGPRPFDPQPPASHRRHRRTARHGHPVPGGLQGGAFRGRHRLGFPHAGNGARGLARRLSGHDPGRDGADARKATDE
ncbi:response regulator transcription factor [Candidatus Dactylopiibacterium carminicum]|uniref:response regulator transcription factor n=1 Tax=Candidatus Dactylopiibacterium carminicum TaxID=857335 RepID=UPI001CC32AD1|nr:response regulator [Candidatus Dactylopiibacterium carminicum]